MKHHIGITIDSELFRKIERIRGREKRSTFIEHLIRLGLKEFKQRQKATDEKLAFGTKVNENPQKLWNMSLNIET